MSARGLIGLRALPNDLLGIGPTPFRPGHREFREHALASRESVVWPFPEIGPHLGFRQLHDPRGIRAADIVRRIEHDPNHPCVAECFRLFRAYRNGLIAALTAHEKRHNLGCMPQVTIVRPQPPRFAIQHVAQCGFANIFYPLLVDTTEEDPLINAPVGQDTPKGA